MLLVIRRKAQVNGARHRRAAKVPDVVRKPTIGRHCGGHRAKLLAFAPERVETRGDENAPADRQRRDRESRDASV